MEGVCCVKCFRDSDLKRFVEEHGEPLEEPCEYCGAKTGQSVDVRELETLFKPVIREHYVSYDDLPNYRHVDPMTGDNLEYLVEGDFEVFSDKVKDQSDLLFGILNARHHYKDPIEFDSSSSWFQRESDWTYAPLGEIRDGSLAELTAAIHKHGQSIVTFAERGVLPAKTIAAYNDILGELTHSSLEVPRAESLWRARLGERKRPKELVPPPPRLATPGRCNLGGQPMLYVASNMETAVSEIRPGKHSVVSVAEFHLKRLAKVCDLLAKPRPISPFVDFKAYQRELRRRALADTVGRTLATPVRPGDEPAEYLVTQVLCRMIFSKGFDGIRYHSAQHDGGVNFVFLEPGLAKPDKASIKQVTIKKVTYTIS